MLGGAMVYNDDWVAVDDNGNYINPITAGIYSIQAREDGRLTKDENVPEETRNELLSILGKTEE